MSQDYEKHMLAYTNNRAAAQVLQQHVLVSVITMLLASHIGAPTTVHEVTV